MALYRNIAGIDNQVGLLLNLKDAFTPPIIPSTPITLDNQPATGGGLVVSQPTVVQILPPGTQWSGSNIDLQANQQAIRDAFAALAAAKQGYYNYLLSTSPYDLTQAGYYVDPDGTIFQWRDASHTDSFVYLSLQDIQDIENTAGTAGTLFMHMGLPILAKDTAGYAGGGRASQGATTMYSTPIAEVLAIPATPTGPNVINDYNPPDPVIPVVTPVGDNTDTSTIPVITTTPTATLVSGNTLGFLALGLAVIGVARSKKLLLAGGLGLLYYSMSKTQNS